jgi:predicted amidohydrolase
MTTRLHVAGAQIPITRDVAENVSALSRAIDFAADEGADILVTPEGSLSGYYAEFDPTEVAEALDDVVSRARDKHVGLALGTCFVEPDDGQCYNQIRFYDPDGAYLGFHSKILRCGTLEEPPHGEIRKYAATPLRTFEIQGITVGGLICNDMWANPKCTPMPDEHLSQQLADMGARIVFHAVHGGSRDDSPASKTARMYHEANLLMRAAAGGIWIVTVDTCSPVGQPCSAPSGVVSPAEEWAYRAAPSGEELFAYTIPLGQE